jgi:hypothetical protein
VSDPKYLLALGAYAALGIAAWKTLDQEFLLAIWILLGVLAIKTTLVVLKRRWD